jgi:hypothetical protein
MNSINTTGIQSSITTQNPPAKPGQNLLASLHAKGMDPAFDLEAMICKDAKHQSKAARQLKQAAHELQQKKFKDAIKQMRNASVWRAVGGAVSVACRALPGFSPGLFGATKALDWVPLASATAGETVGNCIASKDDRDAKEYEFESSHANRKANDANQWMQSVKQLESKMLQQIESFRESTHQARMQSIGQ